MRTLLNITKLFDFFRKRINKNPDNKAFYYNNDGKSELPEIKTKDVHAINSKLTVCNCEQNIISHYLTDFTWQHSEKKKRIAYRKADIIDIPFLSKLYDSAYKSDTKKHVKLDIQTLQNEYHAGHKTYIMYHIKKGIPWCIGAFSFWPENANTIYLSHRAVLPEFQGDGYGNILMKLREKEIAKFIGKNIYAIALNDQTDNRILFWRHYGYNVQYLKKNKINFVKFYKKL